MEEFKKSDTEILNEMLEKLVKRKNELSAQLDVLKKADFSHIHLRLQAWAKEDNLKAQANKAEQIYCVIEKIQTIRTIRAMLGFNQKEQKDKIYYDRHIKDFIRNI